MGASSTPRTSKQHKRQSDERQERGGGGEGEVSKDMFHSDYTKRTKEPGIASDPAAKCIYRPAQGSLSALWSCSKCVLVSQLHCGGGLGESGGATVDTPEILNGSDHGEIDEI